jgi:hypothetical protein
MWLFLRVYSRTEKGGIVSTSIRPRLHEVLFHPMFRATPLRLAPTLEIDLSRRHLNTITILPTFTCLHTVPTNNIQQPQPHVGYVIQLPGPSVTESSIFCAWGQFLHSMLQQHQSSNFTRKHLREKIPS